MNRDRCFVNCFRCRVIVSRNSNDVLSWPNVSLLLPKRHKNRMHISPREKISQLSLINTSSFIEDDQPPFMIQVECWCSFVVGSIGIMDQTKSLLHRLKPTSNLTMLSQNQLQNNASPLTQRNQQSVQSSNRQPGFRRHRRLAARRSPEWQFGSRFWSCPGTTR